MFDGADMHESHRTAVDLKANISRLRAERALALLEGLGANSAYFTDLDYDLAVAREAYVGAAVTEIATLHAELSGPRVG